MCLSWESGSCAQGSGRSGPIPTARGRARLRKGQLRPPPHKEDLKPPSGQKLGIRPFDSFLGPRGRSHPNYAQNKFTSQCSLRPSLFQAHERKTPVHHTKIDVLRAQNRGSRSQKNCENHVTFKIGSVTRTKLL